MKTDNAAGRYSPDMPIESWVQMFETIYFPSQNYERTDTEIICRLLEHVGNVGKFVLKRPDPDGIGKYLARTFAWYCALCIRLGRRGVADFVWHKFPYVCAYCGEAPCDCGKSKRPAPTSQLEEKRISNLKKKPRNMHEFEAMFAEIYTNRNVDSLKEDAFEAVQSALPFSEPSLETNFQVALGVAFGRLVEELGELAETIRLRYFHPERVEDELADIFAWLIGISNLLNVSGKMPGGFHLADAAWRQYPGKCRFCDSSRCKCTSEPVEDVVTVAGIVISRHLDRLTGLGNRDAWDKLCATSETQIESVNRSLPLSLIMLDLDGFKQINDKFGHPQGDSVLADVAELIGESAIPRGQAFRLGGDEFCIVLSNFDLGEAKTLAEKMCSKIINHRFTNISGGEPVSVGASFGVASFQEASKTERILDQKILSNLYKDADKKLYESKHGGKGKVF